MWYAGDIYVKIFYFENLRGFQKWINYIIYYLRALIYREMISVFPASAGVILREPFITVWDQRIPRVCGSNPCMGTLYLLVCVSHRWALIMITIYQRPDVFSEQLARQVIQHFISKKPLSTVPDNALEKTLTGGINNDWFAEKDRPIISRVLRLYGTVKD